MSLGLRNILLGILFISSTACSANLQEQEMPSPTGFILTSPPAPSSIPRPTVTTLPPSPVRQPTVPPVDGITINRVNVRAEPSTASNVLGIIPPDMRVEIVGKDPGGNWWQILYPQGTDPDGKGWVTAQYISTANQPQVPVIGGVDADPSNGPVAIIQQKINIRSGPGTGFDSIGTLNAQEAVDLTGKDSKGMWLQIEFGSGPEGKGWISAAFVQARGVEDLPIVTEAGLVIGTGTPTSIPLTSTPTVVPAWEDHDSATDPVVNILLEPTGTQFLIYNGDVSAPKGDAQDWIQLTSYTQTLLLEVSCEGSNLEIEILQSGSAVAQTDTILCGSRLVVDMEPNVPVIVRISARSVGTLNYTSYTLHLKVIP